jgi:hypothetical protein
MVAFWPRGPWVAPGEQGGALTGGAGWRHEPLTGGAGWRRNVNS